jgi:hypothetical protein
MDISNKKRSKRIMLAFNLGAVVLMVLVIFFIWKEMDMEALITGGVLVLYIIGFLSAGFNYVHYRSDGDKLSIKYYPVVSFFGKEYNAIEFNKQRLFKAEIKRPFIFSNLHIEVKTKKGIAEFPSVSLAAMRKNDIRAIQNDLFDLAQ